MIKEVKKGPKVSICRQCAGNGHILDSGGQAIPCPQCEGSGRVIVSSQMKMDIRPFKPRLSGNQKQ